MSGVKDSDLQTVVDDMNRLLMKVSDYARMKGVSTTGVYFWERTGKIRTVSISGVKFVVLDEDGERD
jgi:predicted site-specific integrase-resolvase